MTLDEPLDVQSMDENWVNKRWPTQIFYGEKGQLMHPHTRIQTPNLELMNCYYMCKSYRTFGCNARLQMREKIEHCMFKNSCRSKHER